MATRLVVRITPSDVGSRVSVRSKIPTDGSQPGMTDTVGRLLRWSAGTLAIERRNGSVAELAETDLLAGKVLPDSSRTAGHPPRREDG